MAPSAVVSLNHLELTSLLCAVASLLLFAHLFGYLFARAGLPRVMGEISGGLLLGPTVLGTLQPNIYRWLFSSFQSEGQILTMISWLGLVLLMFTSGFEIHSSLTRGERQIVIAVTAGSTVIPFIVGVIAPLVYDFTPYLGQQNNLLALQLLIGIATSITSIPVISRIFIDLNMMHTQFAKIVLVTASIHDVILYVALAVASNLVSTQAPSIQEVVGTTLFTIALFALILIAAPRIARVVAASWSNKAAKSSYTGPLLLTCFLFAALASALNINVIFGAFLAGIAVRLMSSKSSTGMVNIKEVSLGFFVPLYFALVGLRLDLIHHFDLIFFLCFLVFTTAIQMLATVLAARLVRQTWLSSFNLGIAMTTRGGPGIVLATVALDLGIINETFFVTLVSIAIVTSVFAGVWFRFILSRGLTFIYPAYAAR